MFFTLIHLFIVDMVIIKITESQLRSAILNVLNERKAFGYAGGGDEYYTREEDVREIFDMLGGQLNGKVVYCPCDNPKISMFYKILKEKYQDFGLRGLFATWIDGKAAHYNGRSESIKDITSGRFQDNGYFFDVSDVIVTNPPFSDGQPSQLFNMVHSRGKEYIMVADRALTQLQNMFQYVRDGSLRTLDKRMGKYNGENGESKGAPSAVYTNMKRDVSEFTTGVKYNPRVHKKFDNLDAIDCGDDFNMIPDDYYGWIAVSSNGGGFLRKLNDEQFEVYPKLVRPMMNGKPKKRMLIRRKRQ